MKWHAYRLSSDQLLPNGENLLRLSPPGSNGYQANWNEAESAFQGAVFPAFFFMRPFSVAANPE
jgi:hypothetical protein